MADLGQRGSEDLEALLLDAIQLELTVCWQELGAELGEMGRSGEDSRYTISFWYCPGLRGWMVVTVDVVEELVEVGAAIMVEYASDAHSLYHRQMSDGTLEVIYNL